MHHGPLLTVLTIPSCRGLEKVALAVLRTFTQEFSHRKAARFRTALAEAVTNAIEHGNEGEQHLDVIIRFICYPRKLEVTVEDSGRGGAFLVPTEKPDIDKKVIGEAPARGWGMYLMKTLVDEFGVEYLPGQRNLVRMAAYAEPRSSANPKAS